MFGKITEFAIEVNRITVVALVSIVVIGVLIFLDYPRQEDPSIETYPVTVERGSVVLHV